MKGARTFAFDRATPEGVATAAERLLAEEVPIAIEVNGVGYAVMMASPADLEDFATGFVLAERLAAAGEIEEVDVVRAGGGVLVRIQLAAHRHAAVFDRVRHRTTDSACGLCGIDSLEAALRPLPRLPAVPLPQPATIFVALRTLRDHQPLNRATGAVHAAALCGADGTIRLVREDVGRHNAFDKLIGAMVRGRLGWEGGFALLSSRCSYDLVEKAVLAGCPLLATVSAPTALAADRAREAGLALAVLAREDALLWQAP